MASPKSRAAVGAAAPKGSKRAAQASRQLDGLIGDTGSLLASSARPRRSQLSVLRRLFERAGKAPKHFRRERVQLVDDIAKAIDNGPPLHWRHFGCSNWRGVAELIVRHFEGMESLSAATFKAFSDPVTRRGHESGVRGMLFNRFVRNFTPLWDDLTDGAKESVERLNGSLRETAGTKSNKRLVDARGKPVHDSGLFSRDIKRGQELTIVLRRKDGELFELDSVDDVLVTSAPRKGGGEYWLLPAQVESKTPGAAGGFTTQIADAQIRFGELEVVSIKLKIEDAGRRIEIPAERLTFDLHDSTNYAVSAFAQKGRKNAFVDSFTVSEQEELGKALRNLDLEAISRLSQFRAQSTEKGGGMSFRRLDVAMDITPLIQMVRAALLAGSRPPR